MSNLCPALDDLTVHFVSGLRSLKNVYFSPFALTGLQAVKFPFYRVLFAFI